MTQWNRALVTGASSGIGLQIARQLAGAGTALVIVARDEQRLAALASSVEVECEVLVADLATRDGVERVVGRLTDTDAPIDLLVNNAGFGFQGDFHELDVEREVSVVDVNVSALLRLAHAAASSMVAAGGGGILNVSSMAGFAGAPGTATYAATKAFVTSFSEALHTELEPHGVHVTALCPGFTRTEFQDRANYDASGVPAVLWQSASDVAAAGLRGVAANRTVVVPGVMNRLGAATVNALPGTVRRFALSKLPR
jgi:short-subunit dehydrogenase